MKRVWVALWLAVLALGLVGVYQRLAYGHAAAGYTSYVPWGLWVALYICLIGLSAGAFLLSTLVYVFGLKSLERIGRLSLFTALVTLVAALLAIWFDLGHMGRFWKVFLRPNFGSLMAWMVWLYTAYFLVLVGELWSAMRADLVRLSDRQGPQARVARALTFGNRDLSRAALENDARRLRLLGTIGVPLAVAFHGGVGALFAVVEARPYWNSALLPILFLVSALTSGGALLTFVVAFLSPDKGTEAHRHTVRYLGRLTLGLLVLDLILELSEFLVGLYTTIPSHGGPIHWIISGPNWWSFWLVTVLGGAVIPIVLLTRRSASVSQVGVAGLLISVSFIAVRLNIVVPGLIVPPLSGLATAYVEPRLAFHYAPTVTEWLVTLFILAVGVGLFYLGYNKLPITGESRREA